MKRLEDFLLEIVQDFDRYQSDDIELNDWAAYEWEDIVSFTDEDDNEVTAKAYAFVDTFHTEGIYVPEVCITCDDGEDYTIVLNRKRGSDTVGYEWELLTPFGDRRKYADALYGTVYDLPRFTFV